MNHNSPIRNDKLLREAYEAGRRDALNEQAGNEQAGMGGPPARFGSGQFGRTQARSGGEGGGGGVGHPNPNAPVGYPPRMPWPPLVGPPGGAGNPPPPAAVKGAKPIPARDPVTGKVVGHWFVGRLDEQGNYCPSCPLAWHYKPSFGSGSMPGTNI